MNKVVLSAPKNGEIRVSALQAYDSRIDFSAFSAKYVVRGCEQYRIDNRTYLVESGEYIVGNASTSSHIIIDSPQTVLGICLDIQPELIQEILDFEYGSQPELAAFILQQEKMVNRYTAAHTHLGYAIRHIEQHFEALTRQEAVLHQELFYTLGECMVKDQVVLWQQFSRLKTVKHETSKRLFDFLHAARLYIERHYLEPIALSSIAQEAHLSEYHFIRLFKKLFGRTPYQYVLHLRLQHAQLLMQQGYGVAEVAFQTGFADKSAFCKAFKKKFGQTTSALK